MSKYSKALIGSVVVALLAGVFAISVAFADEPNPPTGAQGFYGNFVSKLAKALGKGDEEVRGAITQAQKDIINEALEQGRIGQEQANKALERVEKGGLFAGIPRGPRLIPPRAKGLVAKQHIFKAAADFLSLPPGQLLKSLREGQSLAEVAQAQGKTREELKTAIVDSTKQALDKLVANGKLAQQRADTMLQQLQENLDKVIDQKYQGPSGGNKPPRPNKLNR